LKVNNLLNEIKQGCLKREISPQRHGGIKNLCTDNQIFVSFCLRGEGEKQSFETTSFNFEKSINF